MKKIIAFAVFVLFIILAAKAVIWGVQFIRGSTLNSSDGRTNILILGIGGGTHEGAD